MKIVIPNYCTPDSFVDNVSYTLRKLGHEVINIGEVSNQKYNSYLSTIARELVKRLSSCQYTAQEKWLLKQVRESNFDVVLTLTQPLHPNILDLLKDKSLKTACWWGDPSANMKNRGLLTEGWDIIYIKDRYAAGKLKGLGLNAHHMHEAMNPDWHKKMSEQKNNALVFAGSFYEYRHYLTQKLLDDGYSCELYGGRVPWWADQRIKSIHSGKFVVREEKSHVFGAGLAVVNSTSMREFDSVNCRAFEIAGAAGLQIMEYRSAIEECFEPGKEILVYHSYDELKELIERAKKEPAEMQKIRNAAHKRALSEHTYRHRLTRILNDIKQL